MQTHIYTPDALPDHIRWQILSGLRWEWAFTFQGKNRGRRWISRSEYNPLHCVLMDDDFVVGYATIMWINWSHKGKTYSTFGLSNIFIYPDYRGEGHGKTLVQAATSHIASIDHAQIGMLWCEADLQHFYEKCGWRYMSDSQTLLGTTREEAQIDPDQLLFMQFFDDTIDPTLFDEVYFGWTTW